MEVLEHFSQLVTSRVESLQGQVRLEGGALQAGRCQVQGETARNWHYKVSSIRELVPR